MSNRPLLVLGVSNDSPGVSVLYGDIEPPVIDFDDEE